MTKAHVVARARRRLRQLALDAIRDRNGMFDSVLARFICEVLTEVYHLEIKPLEDENKSLRQEVKRLRGKIHALEN